MAKASCARLGYFEDKYMEQLIRNNRPAPRSPLIHRGYYSRVKAMRTGLERFLERCPAGAGCQIVNLGAGFDTVYFWLREDKSRWRDDLVYFEVDFPEVMVKKVNAVLKKQSVWPLLDASTQEDLIAPELGTLGTRELRTPHCRYVSADMRIVQEMAAELQKAGFRSDLPTIFLSECVLVYMQSLHGDSIIDWAARAVPDAPSAMIVYEQFNPSDPFGKVMVENLAGRGCPLLSIHEYPTLDAQRQRYLQRGWERCSLADMKEVYYKHIDRADVERIQKLELLDEFEEFHLIQQHYFFLVATRAPAGAAAWVHEVAGMFGDAESGA
jgi:O-methyltransferase involved in polyketide biosynthesis